MLNRANDFSVSVVKWLATRNAKLVMGSNQIKRLFVTPFSLIVLVFLSLISFLYSFCLLFFFHIFSALFFLHLYSLQVYFKFAMQKYDINLKLRLRSLCLSSYLLHHYILSLSWLYLSKKLFHQFLSQNHLRQI